MSTREELFQETMPQKFAHSFEKAQKLRTECKYEKLDVRRQYFGIQESNIYNWHRQFLLSTVAEAIKNGVINAEAIHAQGLIISSFPDQAAISNWSAFNNRRLFLDCFATFENCLTRLCDGILRKDEKDELLLWKFPSIKKHLIGISSAYENEIKKTIKEKDLVQVPLWRKLNALFKKCENYSGEIIKDREYIEFVTTFRNSHHSNFVYHGKDKTYRWGPWIYNFRPNTVVRAEGPEHLKLYINLDIAEELSDIWNRIITSIKHDQLIKYQENPFHSPFKTGFE